MFERDDVVYFPMVTYHLRNLRWKVRSWVEISVVEKYCQSISASKIYMFLLQWRQLIPFGTCWGAEVFLGLDSQPLLNRGIQTKASFKQMLSCIARF